MGEEILLWFYQGMFPSFIFLDLFQSLEGRLNFQICMLWPMFESLIKKPEEQVFITVACLNEKFSEVFLSLKHKETFPKYLEYEKSLMEKIYSTYKVD